MIFRADRSTVGRDAGAASPIQTGEGVKIVHATERRRLVANLYREPACAVAVVLKCGACLALLILLAVIGAADGKDGIEQDGAHGAPHSAPPVKLSGSAAHRKEIFDGRRARFLANASGRDVASRSVVSHVDMRAP